MATRKVTATSINDEFDLLLGKARKANILTTIQINRLSDYMTREIGRALETERRLTEADTERKMARPARKRAPRLVPIVGSAEDRLHAFYENEIREHGR